MTTQVSGYIGKINPGNGTNYALGSTAYGYCETAGDTAAKVVDMTGFELVTGATIFVKFKNANSAASPTLNVNSTGAKPMYRYGTTAMSTTSGTNGWTSGAILTLTYDGKGWVEHYWNNNTYTLYGAYCTTAADTADKVAACVYYQLNPGYFELTMRYDNTAEGPLTLNVASKGAKPIYINGSASSASNCTLPGGIYFVFYDGTNYYFRTDGSIEGISNSGSMNGYLPLSGGTVTGTLILSKATDASATANNSPALIVGGSATAAHLEFDGNEILAKKNGTTATTLNINTDGGLVSVGSGGLSTTGNITASKFIGNLQGDAESCYYTQLTDEDLDTIIPDVATFYYAAGSNSITNTPLTAGRSFAMIVVRISTSYRAQILISPDNIWYIRKYSGSTWGAWTQMKFTDTKYTATTESIGSASKGTAIAADDITAWDAGSAASFSVSSETLTITSGAAPSLSYTARSIPNISVTSKTVVNGITES